MNKEDINNKLEKIIEYDKIKTSEKNYISIDDFLDKFSDSELTYNSLTEHENCTEIWKKRFDSWKDEGLIE